MNWIRIATKMKSDPKLGRIAAACGVPMPTALGLVCCVLLEFPDHAPDGDIGAVPDVVLEQWAGWQGDGGAFAAAFRDHLCDETGLVTGWEKHNGAALRRAKSDIERKRADAEARKVRRHSATPRAERVRNSTGIPAEHVRNDCGIPHEFRTVSAVDETRRNETTTSSLRADVVVRGALTDEATVTLPFADPTHAAAAAGYARAHQFPDAFRATLSALASGQGAPNGQPVPWETIGQALCEMQGAGARFTPNALRAFVRRLQEKPATPLTWDDLLTPVPDESGVTHVA